MQARKAKSDLAQLMQCKKVFVSITSHFSKDMFTVAALDSFDHQDHQPLIWIKIMTRVKFFQAGSHTIQTSAKFNKFEDSFRLGILSSSLSKNTTI